MEAAVLTFSNRNDTNNKNQSDHDSRQSNHRRRPKMLIFSKSCSLVVGRTEMSAATHNSQWLALRHTPKHAHSHARSKPCQIAMISSSSHRSSSSHSRSHSRVAQQGGCLGVTAHLGNVA
jgi:hypothetical protein